MNHMHDSQRSFVTSRPCRAAGRLLVAAGLALLVAGCTQLPPALVTPEAAPATSARPDAADCPAEKMVITKVRWFRDGQGAWRVVGMIHNQWDRPVSKVVTGADPLDATGQLADGHGEDISVYPLNLQPGEQAPYSAWIKRDIPGLDHFHVEAEECVLAESLERSHVEVSKDRFDLDDAGHAQISGEIANPGNRPVLVDGLTAAVLDAGGAPVAVEQAEVSPRYLAPGEHGPFRISLDLPSGGAGLVKSYRLYKDVVVTDPDPAVIDVARDVHLTSRYVDGAGQFHVTGEVTNRGAAPITLRLQTAVYDGPAKDVVAAAATFDTDRPLAPGETRQFDMIDWGPVDAQGALARSLAGGDRPIEVRVEPFGSWANG